MATKILIKIRFASLENVNSKTFAWVMVMASFCLVLKTRQKIASPVRFASVSGQLVFTPQKTIERNSKPLILRGGLPVEVRYANFSSQCQ